MCNWKQHSGTRTLATSAVLTRRRLRKFSPGTHPQRARGFNKPFEFTKGFGRIFFCSSLLILASVRALKEFAFKPHFLNKFLMQHCTPQIAMHLILVLDLTKRIFAWHITKPMTSLDTLRTYAIYCNYSIRATYTLSILAEQTFLHSHEWTPLLLIIKSETKLKRKQREQKNQKHTAIDMKSVCVSLRTTRDYIRHKYQIDSWLQSFSYSVWRWCVVAWYFAVPFALPMSITHRCFNASVFQQHSWPLKLTTSEFMR